MLATVQRHAAALCALGRAGEHDCNATHARGGLRKDGTRRRQRSGKAEDELPA